MSILNIGSMNIDYVYKVEHIVSEGETQNVSSVETKIGGKGLNQSVAAAKAGSLVYHAGIIGNGGEILTDYLKESKVDISLIRKSDTNQGHALIQVDKQGKNSILVYGGSNRMITKDYVDEIFTEFDNNDFLMVNNEISELEYIIKKAYEKSIRVVLNASPIDKSLLNMNLDMVTYLVINEIEGKALSNQREPYKILEAILKKHENIKIILTLGPDGSIYSDKEKTIYQESYKVKAKDTTAAGDTFMGYFVAGLAKGLEIEKCLKSASMAAAITVTKSGAAETIPDISIVQEKLQL